MNEAYKILGEASRLRADDVKEGFASLHRTEQQNLFRNILAIVEQLAELGDAQRCDLRNNASVAIAQEIRNHGLIKPVPYI